MDDCLRDTTSMETMLLDAFQNDDKLGNDARLVDTFFKSFKFASTTPVFGLGGQSNSTQLGTKMLLYNLKEKFGLSNACFSKILS